MVGLGVRAKLRSAGLVALLVFATACASPVGVQRVDGREVHRALTTNVLAHGRLSAPSRQLLVRLGLTRRFEDEPEATLEELRSGLVRGDEDRLFALAELSFWVAERGHAREHYLASSVYAYAFLFGGEPPAAVDPRLRLAVDLYNRGLTEGLERMDRHEVDLSGRAHRLPHGWFELIVDPHEFDWGGRRLSSFVPVAELDVKGLRNRYRRPGIGAPLAASVSPPKPGDDDARSIRLSPDVKVPVTAFFRIDDPLRAIETGHVRATLELYAADETRAVPVGDEQVPLEYELSSSLAFALHGQPIWQRELGGFLSVEFGDVTALPDGLYMLHPYHPHRVPIVLVHGTASSPERWAELINELYGDPKLSRRIQIWLFAYNTHNPVAYSATFLRESIRDAIRELDPAGGDAELRHMMVVGHSQGGLLARLVASNSEGAFWEPSVPEGVTDEVRLRLARSRVAIALPEVRRVVYIATPHRGSFLITKRVADLIRGLLKLPATLVGWGIDIVRAGPDVLAMRRRGALPSSLNHMDPHGEFVAALARLKLAEGVHAHSIIPVRRRLPFVPLSDGVVAFRSAHLEGVDSELVVEDAGHSVQSHRQAIEEIRRIVVLHLAELPAAAE